MIMTPPARIVNQYIANNGSIPFKFGEQDAQNGTGCVPEMCFRHIDDKRDYCAGYQSIAGPTLTTCQFLGGAA